jgi:hypothetical protein
MFVVIKIKFNKMNNSGIEPKNKHTKKEKDK